MRTSPDWTGRTVVCIASGPSLAPVDCELVRASRLPTVVTNTTFRLCVWADALMACDPEWWATYLEEVQIAFSGALFSAHASIPPAVRCAFLNPRFRSFRNTGADAVALAVAHGAARVIMLGYDCSLTSGSHHHGDHPPNLRNCDSIARWPERFAELARWAARSAEVMNASRATALDCFARVPLDQALRG